MDVTTEGSFPELNTSFAGLRKREATVCRSEVFYNAGSEQSCLLCFISLYLARDDEGQYFAKLLWTYPHPPASVLEEYSNLGMFVLANTGTSYSAEQLTYTFVLTDSQGVRKYGHSTAFVNGEIAVAISPYPWCNFFYHLAYLYRTNGDDLGKEIVKALCNSGTPPSGAEFLTPIDLGVSFKRPYDRLCSFIDTSPLAMLVIFPDNTTLFTILADLLLEKHIIIVGPNFSLVSNVIMSLQALIAPFDWMHILIPILPTALLDVLAAPPPYLVGILTSQLPLIERVPIDGVVLVYLGANGICERVEHCNEVADQLPHSGPLSAIRIGLSLLRLRHPRDQTVCDLCSFFLTYYASVFGEMALRGSKGYIKRGGGFSEKVIVFYEKLLSAQSFNIVSEEVNRALSMDDLSWMDNEFIVAVVRAHSSIYPQKHAQLIDKEKQGGGYVAKYSECFGSRETFTNFTAAVHGFGGHKFGVYRLLTHYLCGRWCVSPYGDEEGNAHCYVAAGLSIEDSIHRKLYCSAPSGAPVIVADDARRSVLELGQCFNMK